MQRFALTFLRSATLAISALMATHAAAQTSKDLVKADFQQQYAAMKTAFETLYKAQKRAFYFAGSEPEDFNLGSCQSGVDFLGGQSYEASVNEARLADVAYRVVYISRNLGAIGYPDTIWKDRLARYEDVLRSRPPARGNGPSDGVLDRAYTAKLIPGLLAALTLYRKQHPAFRKVVFVQECGDAGAAVRIVTKPTGGNVSYIPNLFYLFCKAQGIDPEDTRRCNRWRDIAEDRVEHVDGNYRYVARWPDGVSRRGELRIGANDDGTTITLRRP